MQINKLICAKCWDQCMAQSAQRILTRIIIVNASISITRFFSSILSLSNPNTQP